MRKYLVGGNWKCNGNLKFSMEFPQTVLNKLVFDTSKVDVVVCPTTLHLSAVKSFLNHQGIHVGCQNISLTGNGAFTGEIAAHMIKDMGVDWCLTGHSERRGLYGEDDRDMALKTKFGLDNGMSVMACIGESLVERKLNKTKMVNER